MKKQHAIATLVLSAALVLLLVGCETTPTQQGALVGGVLGAGAGAVIGNQSHGQGGTGALIGGAVGALGGALVGDQVGQSRRRAAAQPTLPPPPSAPAPAPVITERGHYENRIVRTASGETYEERIWVPDR